MFGHKCFLRIGTLNDSSIRGLYRDSHELTSCRFGFDQGMDHNGKAQTEVRGGRLYLTYPNVPPDIFISWMLNPVKLENGVLVVCDENDMPLEKVYFEEAACIEMDICYHQKGDNYTSTMLTLEAKKITIGTVSLEKRWRNL